MDSRASSADFTTSSERAQPFGPPLIGALLRVPWEAVQRRMLERLHERGFDDLDAAHLTVFQYPGPQGARPSELAARLGVETMEERAVPASHKLDGLFRPPPHAGAEVVYVESNNPADGQNAVLAYQRNPGNGHLTRLGSFATGDVARYLQEMTGADAPDALVRRIHERTGGNPFFVRETVRTLSDRTLTDVRSTYSDVELPGPARDVIRRRVAALP